MDTSLEALKRELSNAVADLDSEQTQARPERAGAWSIQRIVEHLLLTYDSTIELLEARVAKGTPTKKPATLQQRMGQFAVTRCGYFPPGRTAPDQVTPAANGAPRDGHGLAEAISEKTKRLETVAIRCERVLGPGRVVTHFVMGPMSIAQWNRFHLTHARHHIKQIQAIRARQAISVEKPGRA